MAKDPTCLVCQKVMEFGFMAERTQGTFSDVQSINLPRWCKGDPTASIWRGGEASMSQYREGCPVVAYRCPECKALRLYAPDPQ